MTSLFPGLDDAVKLSTKSPLRYPGGKTRAIKVLSTLVPHDVLDSPDSFVLSPFVGGGSFELWLTAQGKPVQGYDVFSQLAVFWNQCQHHPEELSAALTALHAQGVGSETFKRFQTDLRAYEVSPGDTHLTDLEVATRFFVVNRCSFSGSTLSGGFSQQSATGRFTESSIEKVRHWNNPKFTVERGDAFDVLSSSETVSGADFLFLDPPYMLGKTKDKLYGDKGSTHDGFDHERFKETLDTVSSSGTRFLLTYNDSEEIRELYRDYVLIDTSWTYGMNASKKSSELIVTNYEIDLEAPGTTRR